MKTNKFYLHYLLFITSAVLFSSYNHAHSLENAINSIDRSSKNVSRDKYRNPLNTLSFFKLKNNMKVIELQPSGGNSPGGWYTEILAPYLKKNGLLIAAHFNPKESEWRAQMRKGYEKRIENNEDFNKIQMAVLSMPPVKLNPDNSVDMVLTFRNLHNWLKAG